MNKKSNGSRQQILEKSKNVFIRKGFSNVSMKDIVEECNISRGGLYHHFPSVAELFAEMIEKEDKINNAQNDSDNLNAFFDNLKTKLINIDMNLLRAAIEYELAYDSAL